MKLVALSLTVGLPAAASTAQAQDASALLEKYNCRACHADSEARTGPSFAEIAAKYKGNPKGAAILRGAVKSGEHGGGPWHMPPFRRCPMPTPTG